MANKPLLHRRDHERGGADPVRLLWDDGSGGEGGVGVNDALVHVTWTYLGGTFALDTTVADTLEDGTTPGFWQADGSGATMACLLEGSWQIDVAGTVTHSGTTAPTIVRFVVNGSSATDIFSVDMADTDSAPLSYTTSQTFAVDDNVKLTVTHAIGSGTPSSTLTGTMVFTLL